RIGGASMSNAIYCIACGYDLRATASGVCPECGQGYDPSNPRTFARSLYDVWPSTELKLVLISEIVLLVLYFGVRLLTASRLDIWDSLLLMGCFFLLIAMMWHCFILIYSWVALAMSFRRVMPRKRLIYTLVMLSPTLITGSFWLWI
ncbi:MAG: hypothetical protein AB8C95_10060, partial [Phycisphaeraceae bacterium]